ncbi:hypothetical protein JXR93_04550 [bacterium]|nr:hypothetical protein [bacterium]
MWIFVFLSLPFETPFLGEFTETTTCNNKNYIVYLKSGYPYLRDLTENTENPISGVYGFPMGLFCENSNLYIVTLDYDIGELDKYYFYKYRENEQMVELITSYNDNIMGTITPHSFNNTLILKKGSSIKKYIFSNENVTSSTLFSTTSSFDRFATTPPYNIAVISNSQNLIIRDIIGEHEYSVLTNSKILDLIKDDNNEYYMLVSNGSTLYIYKIHSDFTITQIHSKTHDQIIENGIFYKENSNFYGYLSDSTYKLYIFEGKESFSNLYFHYNDSGVTKIQKSNLYPIYLKTGTLGSVYKVTNDFSILNKPTILYPNGVIDTYIHPDIYIQSPNRYDLFSSYRIDISRSYDFLQIDKSISSVTLSDEESQKNVVDSYSFSIATPYYIRAYYYDIFSRKSEYSYSSFIKNSDLNLLTLSVYDKTTNSVEYSDERDVVLYTQGESNLENIELSFNSDFSNSQILSVGGEQTIELPNVEGINNIFVRGVVLDQSNIIASTNQKESSIFLDLTKPISPVITSGDSFDNNIQITWNPSSDSGSGLSKYILNIKKDGFSIYQKEISKDNITHLVETTLQNGLYSIELYSVDLAGNISIPSLKNITLAKKPLTISDLDIEFNSLTPKLTFEDDNDIVNKNYKITLFKGDLKLTEWTLFDQNPDSSSKTVILPKYFYKHGEKYRFSINVADNFAESDSKVVEKEADLSTLKPAIPIIISETGEISLNSYNLKFNSVLAPSEEVINYKIYKNSVFYSEIGVTEANLNDLEENSGYVIEVEACDNSISLCSDRDSVDIFVNQIEESPSKVDILEPLNLSIIKEFPFDIRWSESIDPEGTIITYHITLSDKSDYSKVILEFFDVQDTKKTVNSLKGGKYYLKIIAKDSKNNLSEISEISFEIESKSNNSSGCSFY